MNIFRHVLLCALCASLVVAAGCISVEKKEYRFRMNADGSGAGTIRFVNIVSSDDNGKDVSFKDFAELVTDYLQGTKFEDDYPALHVTGKKLVEENGQLVGEVSFTLASFDSAGFFRAAKCECCPTLFFIGTDKGQETVTESSGTIITDVAPSPFIEWQPKSGDLTLKTTLMEDTSNIHTMLPHYRQWAKK